MDCDEANDDTFYSDNVFDVGDVDEDENEGEVEDDGEDDERG